MSRHEGWVKNAKKYHGRIKISSDIVCWKDRNIRKYEMWIFKDILYVALTEDRHDKWAVIGSCKFFNDILSKIEGSKIRKLASEDWNKLHEATYEEVIKRYKLLVNTKLGRIIYGKG